MALDNFNSVAATLGGSFFAGVLIGYALKKVAKLATIVVGLFFAGLAYLQYQKIIDIKWVELQSVSQNAVTTIANATTEMPGFSNGAHATALSNLGIPLTGSISMGIAIGFMKG